MASAPLRRRDVIDTAARFSETDAAALNARFEGVPTLAMLRAVLAEGLAGRVAVVSSIMPIDCATGVSREISSHDMTPGLRCGSSPVSSSTRMDTARR